MLPEQFCSGRWHTGEEFFTSRRIIDPRGLYGDTAGKILLTLWDTRTSLSIREIMSKNGWEYTPSMRQQVAQVLYRLSKAGLIVRPYRGKVFYAQAPKEDAFQTHSTKKVNS